MIKLFLSGFIIFVFIAVIYSQDDDTCGWNNNGKEKDILQEPGFGYSYDSLLTDLQRWSQNPCVQIDSAGSAVQGRTLWLITIQDTLSVILPRWRITIHA